MSILPTFSFFSFKIEFENNFKKISLILLIMAFTYRLTWNPLLFCHYFHIGVQVLAGIELIFFPIADTMQ